MSSSVAFGPANRAEYIPGRPPSASISIPESSAIVGSPVMRAKARALATALASKVVALFGDVGQVLERGEVEHGHGKAKKQTADFG